MRRQSAWILCAVLFAFACWAAAANPIVGTWQFVATDTAGQDSTWTMVVKEDGGKLAGSISGGQGTLEMVEPKLKGKLFTFTVNINDQPYKAELTVDGNKLEGKYTGPEASGTIKGSKQE